LHYNPDVVVLAGSRIRQPREWLIAIALVCACGDSTHTVGALAAVRSPGGGAGGGAQAGRNGNGASSSTDGSTSMPGDVGTPGSGGDAGPLDDPILMVGDPAFSCRGEATAADRRPLDLLLLVDINLFDTVGTVTEGLNAAWLQIARGISEYVDDPRAAGTGVGIEYFPPPITQPLPACDVVTYSVPFVPVMPLPENAAEIKRTIPAPLGLGSPTLPALEGGLRYAKSQAEAIINKQAVVLVTDRVSDFSCFSNPAAIVDAADRGWTGRTPVATYVVALSSPVLEAVQSVLMRNERLDEVAAKGGTGRAREVDLDVSGVTLADTLYAIQREAEPCQYQANAAVKADPTATALGTVVVNGKPVPLPRLAAASECGHGYYFDDPAKPDWATLCKDTCTALKASARSVVWIDECDMP
jgi:hypothetical protein